MTVSAANLKYYLSGGAGNTSPAGSLGGARSTTQVVSGTLDDVFNDVSGPEATAGGTDYRCIYFRNEDVDANGLIAPALWIVSDTPSTSTHIELGLDPVGKNGTATTIANENTAPAGVSFSQPASFGAGLALPTAPYHLNDFVGLWLKRVVTAGAPSALSDPATIRIQGDTV